MKVAIVVPWGERLGGAESMLWTFLRHVDRARLEPVVVFLQGGPFEGEVAALGHATYALNAGRLRQPHRFARTVFALARLLGREQPGLVLAWAPKCHLYAAPAGVLAGLRRRLVWWQHGIQAGGWLDRAATALPTRAVGCSSASAARAQAALRPRRRTFVVYPGVEPPRGGTPADGSERARLGVPDGAVVVGTVGRLQPSKRQHLVLDAVADLRDRGYPVHGLVVGGDAYELSPEYAPALRSRARELGLGAALSFTGHVADPSAYIALMDVVVSPAAEESFGLALVEAMALAKPVVAFPIGGPGEIVEDGVSGRFVREGETLADALEPLVRDPVFRSQLGDGARNRFERCFTWEQMVEGLHRELGALAGG